MANLFKVGEKVLNKVMHSSQKEDLRLSEGSTMLYHNYMELGNFMSIITNNVRGKSADSMAKNTSPSSFYMYLKIFVAFVKVNMQRICISNTALDFAEQRLGIKHSSTCGRQLARVF